MRTRTPILAVVLILFSWRLMSPQGRGQSVPSPAAAFTGAGSCASSTCHGSVWPRTGSRILQDEYQTWSAKDKHAKAYSVLLEARSKQIARNMRIERAETADLCLNCHAMNAPAGQRAATFDITDGVSCEACHGPASAWLGPHTQQGWKHEQSVALGMVDTKSQVKAVEGCLGCHLGNEQNNVDHELIAAGHPALVFEFEIFSALMPAHWKVDAKAEAVTRRWAIAQALALRESMKQLGRRAAGKAWDGFPEFADFECSACHHNLVTPSSRQERGYSARAGVPPWDESRYVVFRHLVSVIDPAQRNALDSAVAALKTSLQNPGASRATVPQNTTRIANLMSALLIAIESRPMDSRFSGNLIRALASDANGIAAAGAHSAAQAAMTADVLYRTMSAQPALNNQINVLYGLLQPDVRYDAEAFARELKKLQ